MERQGKRPLVIDDDDDNAASSGRLNSPLSLTHPISPPRKKNRQLAESKEPSSDPSEACIRSPFQLTTIKDLPPEMNRETIALKDILGDPLISDCWDFNYLHDVDFLMAAFDEDVRSLVKVHVVHGFWKSEDPSRAALQDQASRYKNVSLHAAFMPEMFGTHHSKMLLLLRHDDTAQVVIHTANMIARDWGNLTQGVWRSPLLPLLQPGQRDGHDLLRIGSGEKFKADLLNYLRAYDTRRIICKPIVEQLTKYDFSSVKASLIASVPGKHNMVDHRPTRWGWAALKEALGMVPVQEGKSEIVVQISSIATLGGTDSWLQNTLFKSLTAHKGGAGQKPGFKVVFPTADEIRRSLDGYGSGASIHTKIQSNQQVKQLQYLKPMLCHWANDAPDGKALPEGETLCEAGRKRAAPHIKTYIRYGKDSIDWMLVTSANLSKQAWGEAVSSTTGEMRISSYEIGVLVWPSLYAENAKMVPCFRTDEPVVEGDDGAGLVIGLRMPYNLPLQRYGKDEIPWVATANHAEPDWMGRTWQD